MRRIAILNQKGGVGKTTTAVNLSAALADAGYRVCLLDLDSQAHASVHLGIKPQDDRKTVYDVLVNQIPLSEARVTINDRLAVVASNIDLAAVEVELAGRMRREFMLPDAIAADQAAFDYMIMDCAPSLGVLTLNALAAATEVLIPLQPHFFALHGLSQLLDTTAAVARRFNRGLQVSGILLCMYEATRLAQEVVVDLNNFLIKSRNQPTPWANARLFEARIRRNIKLAECPGFGQSIFQYDPSCAGAEDYRRLANEVLAMMQHDTQRIAA